MYLPQEEVFWFIFPSQRSIYWSLAKDRGRYSSNFRFYVVALRRLVFPLDQEATKDQIFHAAVSTWQCRSFDLPKSVDFVDMIVVNCGLCQFIPSSIFWSIYKRSWIDLSNTTTSGYSSTITWFVVQSFDQSFTASSVLPNAWGCELSILCKTTTFSRNVWIQWLQRWQVLVRPQTTWSIRKRIWTDRIIYMNRRDSNINDTDTCINSTLLHSGTSLCRLVWSIGPKTSRSTRSRSSLPNAVAWTADLEILCSTSGCSAKETQYGLSILQDIPGARVYADQDTRGQISRLSKVVPWIQDFRQLSRRDLLPILYQTWSMHAATLHASQGLRYTINMHYTARLPDCTA